MLVLCVGNMETLGPYPPSMLTCSDNLQIGVERLDEAVVIRGV